MAAGKTKKIKLGVMCILFSEPEEGGERHFLLLHRCLNWRGWEFVKGGVKDAEAVRGKGGTEDAARREIKEEAGLVAVQMRGKLRRKHKWSAGGVNYDYEVLLFAADMDEKVKLQTAPVKEHDNFEWVPQAKVRAKLHYENTKKVFDSILGEI